MAIRVTADRVTESGDIRVTADTVVPNNLTYQQIDNVKLLARTTLNAAASSRGLRCSYHAVIEDSIVDYSESDNDYEFEVDPFTQGDRLITGLFESGDTFFDPFPDVDVTLYDADRLEKGTLVKVYFDSRTTSNYIISDIAEGLSYDAIFKYKLDPMG